MFRFVILISFITLFHYGFSQQHAFERFLKELDSCKAHSETVVYEDSVFAKGRYVLQWTHISGTYGGSGYCCGGEVFRAKSETDTTFPVFSADFYPVIANPDCVSEIIGNRYLIEIFTLPEPQPTSNEHFIYITRYFVIKEN